ncbi:hypothetical protein [Kaistella palustris]|uniref:hypothetical protein n=1 Tax=Kaistella palustris TaxID=493376 RepID=UPI0003FF8A25|nr:hypothetical protein [Kaistella palustris]
MKTINLTSAFLSKLLPLLIIISILVANCQDDGDGPFSPYAGEDIYVAGGMSDNEYTKATYWKNDVPTILQKDQRASMANDIFVSEGGVYAAGNMKAENNIDDRPCYWNRGQFGPLSIEGDSGDATSIFVVVDKTYIVGYDGVNYGAAKLWMGRYTVTYPGVSGARFNSVYVINNTVYIAGIEYEGSVKKAKYWIYKPGAYNSGAPAPFSEAQSFTLAQSNYGLCNASSIAVFGDKVYVAGTDGSRGTLWTDGQATVIDTRQGSNPLSVAVYGDDRYTAGTSGDVTTNKLWFWKNGILTDLNRGNAATGTATSVAAGKSDIYVSGFVNKNGNAKAALWINGVMKSLSPEKNRSWGNKVVVVAK